jgi:hypothetical protein
MFVPYASANDVGNRFLELLHNHGINPPAGSGMEDELLSLTQLLEVMRNPNLAQGQNRVAILRTAAGLHDLAAKVLSVATIQEFSTFIPHLQLIADAKVRAASLGQNAASGYDDDTARKMAELYIGCLAAHVGTDVCLDHPVKSKGDNPDVIFTVEETLVVKTPKRWALAIKTISTNRGQTIFDRISEGAEQIDDPKCQADYGMVIINAKNALDHEALWNPQTPFPDLQAAVEALKAQLEQLIGNAEQNRPQSEWDDLFKGRVVRPIIFMGQSLVKLPTAAHTQTPTPLKLLLAYGANGSLDPIGGGLASQMNKYMQRILLGVPGAHNQPPS